MQGQYHRPSSLARLLFQALNVCEQLRHRDSKGRRDLFYHSQGWDHLAAFQTPHIIPMQRSDCCESFL